MPEHQEPGFATDRLILTEAASTAAPWENGDPVVSSADVEATHTCVLTAPRQSIETGTDSHGSALVFEATTNADCTVGVDTWAMPGRSSA
jgi:hypothetical protein